MHLVRTTVELRGIVHDWRVADERIGFVPTMGNLHAGHLALVERARAAADRVIVSVFVNPTQFGPNEDFDRYPRTENEDAAKLAAAGADLLFLPGVAEMYPGGADRTTFVEVPASLTDQLCGRQRPGHFRGVATVVATLFNLVQPDLAVFGEKDFQQLAVIRRMVRDLAFPVEIIGAPTIREADGLAMSSRNQYLSADERRTAPRLHGVLAWLGSRLREGEPVAVLEADGMAELAAAGFRPEYVAVRDAVELGPPRTGEDAVILAAAHLGRTRLIDNLRVLGGS
ncbi:MAG TPA: pantoate--beta-alanine ligase [Gammaproteobacteria bacterium]